MILLYSFVVGAGLLILGWIIGKVVPSSLAGAETPPKGFPDRGVFQISELREISCLDPERHGSSLVMHVFRQSGDHIRTEIFQSKAEAMARAEALFVKMGEDQFRIWANTPRAFDIRRPFGSSRGTRESRKVWGCYIEWAQTD